MKMSLFKLIILGVAGCLTFTSASAQNVLINILTQNLGIINKGATVFLEVTVCNTDPADAVSMYKLKPQISVPSAIAGIPAAGHNLPAGWSITGNDGSTIRLSNGTDTIPAQACRTILIAIKGSVAGGPSTISGNLLFSNGVAPGSMPGGSTPGDNPADNTSTSTCKIVF